MDMRTRKLILMMGFFDYLDNWIGPFVLTGL